jgi:hypothetical protein
MSALIACKAALILLYNLQSLSKPEKNAVNSGVARSSSGSLRFLKPFQQDPLISHGLLWFFAGQFSKL